MKNKLWSGELLEKLYSNTIPSLIEEVCALNDYMADNPEVGGQETESSRHIVDLLRRHNIDVEYPFAGISTAFKGRINPNAKRRAAFLAEYDALKGFGHACGHCASGSASVLAFLALSTCAEQLGDIGIDIIGTPDEEINGSKCVMVNNGIFNNYDFAAMVHMGPDNIAKADFIALDGTTIKFHGKAAHAAQAPEKGRNAFNAARLFFDAVDMMRQHVMPEAKLHGYVVKSGTASNIVPDYTEIEFLSRAPRRKELNEITEWVYDCAKAAALATHTTYELEQCGLPFDDLFISDAALKLIEESFSELGLEITANSAPCGSTDMGNVSHVCPAFHPIISIGQNYQLHTMAFANAMKDESTHKAIENAAKLLLKISFKLYRDEERLSELKASYMNQ